jgi:hypothetical protein
MRGNPPHSYGEVSTSYGDGGVISGNATEAYDPSARVRRVHFPI